MLRRIYDIDFNALVANLLPIALRQLKLYKYLLCIVSPIQQIHVKFVPWAKNVIYSVEHTGQVIYLEKVLNDIWGTDYDPKNHESTKSIWISDGEAPSREYIYLSSEEQPRHLGTLHLRTISEHDTQYSDFIINVPSNVIFNENRMKALIDKYKLAGKFYKIKIV